ncbi:MAG: hypothetical protein K0U79_04445 [Gammaproteobacteria bacterium]|jgi:hypothetical protein|nr:hypothetical protein [Gammaproteobacteria bacterium]
MHLIVYNAIRLMTLDAAQDTGVTPRCISFKASTQALRQWEPQLCREGLAARDARRLIASPHRAMADAALPDRSGRREPRCIKRYPKPYALLTQRRYA